MILHRADVENINREAIKFKYSLIHGNLTKFNVLQLRLADHFSEFESHRVSLVLVLQLWRAYIYIYIYIYIYAYYSLVNVLAAAVELLVLFLFFLIKLHSSEYALVNAEE